ncbi:immunoglobulin-like domain-containing protein [Evansella tamaricis]|uniref:Thermonuclease family protein n=1 Tax=Evansella tamaricis TaxID=2069301 RepID=A0ABS6JHC0_9BACI|nr:immunoglobulin-like domain-containing protein [Evansella tamaricis]MBU9713071.1 thermonuclease family protein [Evansella tamaricis]
MKGTVKSKKLFSLLLIFTLFFSSFGNMAYALPNHVPDQAKNNAANQVRDVVVTPQELGIALGESAQLEAEVTYSNNKTNTKVDWSSEDTAIATVSKDGVVQASGTETGIVNVTATGSRGRSEKSVDVQVFVYDPESSISESRTKMGETVTVKGIVNVDNYQLQAGNLNVYIQDPTGGIQLFNFNPQIFPDLNEGDYIEVTGSVGDYNGVTQLTVDNITVLGTNKTIIPIEVTINDLMDTEVAEALQGQLITFEGFFQTVPTYFNGGANISAVDEDFNTMVLRVWETTGIVLENFEPDNWFVNTGILSKYQDMYQLLPRKQNDIVLSEEQKDKPTTRDREFEVTVERVVDGDTIRIVEPVFGATNVRFLNMDTAETYHAVRNDLDQHQMDQGIRAGEYLKNYLSDGDRVIVRLGEEPLDTYGRLLAEVITLDGVNTNLEMVRQGQAPTYFIYPFEDEKVAEYAAAAKEARENERGIWNPEDPLLEAPFVFRARERGDAGLARYVGDFETREYVLPDQYAIIPSENRVFFSEEEAIHLGYTKKELTGAELAFVDKNYVKLNVLANHNITRLVDDMTLPATGLFGSEVDWESSDPDVISHDGVINKSLEEQSTVTLTGTLSNDGAVDVLTLEVTVLEPIINIVRWDFEDQSEVADGGLPANATRSISRESTVNPTYPQGTGGSGTFALNTNGWHDGADAKYYVIDFETLGFKNIKLSSRQMGSNTGPRDFQLQYSLDGVNWVEIGQEITVANNWNSAVITDLELPTETENQENVYVRWLMTSNTSINGGTVGSGGTSRIDDIVITGNPTPLSDELAAELDSRNLEIVYQGSDDNTNVTQDVLLPDTGINGSSISWSSSNNAVISDSGVVTQQELDTVVILTAVVTKGSVSVTKTFELTVVGESTSPPVVVEPLIGYWAFNTNGFSNILTSGQDLEADEGLALLRTNFTSISEFAGTTINALGGYPAGGSLSLVGNANNNNYVELEFSTLGLEGIELSFATRGTGTGFNEHQWMYSLDGENWVEFGENTATRNTSFQLETLSLSNEVNNKETVFVRVYLDGATSTSGNNRIDNLQVNGTVIE